MGHQESLLFCATKSDMIKLCNVLNRAAADSSELGLEYVGLDVYLTEPASEVEDCSKLSGWNLFCLVGRRAQPTKG